MHQFHLNQFVVKSEIAFPCDVASCRDYAHSVNDALTIRRASFATKYQDSLLLQPQRFYDVGDAILIRTGPVLARVSLNGRTVEVDVPEEHLAYAPLALLNRCFALCTLLRGGLPLHAAGAELDGKFFGVMAPSGTGKSTLLWALLQSGALFGNDDQVPVLVHDGKTTAFPSVSLFPKVRPETCAHFNIGTTNAIETLPGSNEYWMPLTSSQRVIQLRPLRAMFLLMPHTDERKNKITVARCQRENALRLLPHNLHAFSLWAQLEKEAAAQRLAELVESVPFYVAQYPKRFDVFPQLIKAMRRAL